MAYGFIPMAWRQVKVIFIPKPGKLDYTEVKAYRPIGLSSFLLKTMEKLVDRHIRDCALRPSLPNSLRYVTLSFRGAFFVTSSCSLIGSSAVIDLRRLLPLPP
jgi:hypothetical protein